MNENERITKEESKKMLKVIKNCCRGLIFTKDEGNQICSICMKAVERYEEEQRKFSKHNTDNIGRDC